MSEAREVQLTELCQLWQELIGSDDHKDQDCHFSLQASWDYGDEPSWSYEHQGFITQFCGQAKSYVDCLSLLAWDLRGELRRELRWRQENAESEQERGMLAGLETRLSDWEQRRLRLGMGNWREVWGDAGLRRQLGPRR